MRRCPIRPSPLVIVLGLLMTQMMLAQPARAAGGQLDGSFSGDGKVTTDFTSADDLVTAVVIQSDGKLLAAGWAGSISTNGARFALARYDADGGLDDTFGGDGRVTTNFDVGNEWVNAVAVQSDGKIVAVGGYKKASSNNARFALARYNPSGTLDTSFSGDGRVMTEFTTGYDYAEDVALQSDGKIVVAGGAGGLTRGRFALARYGVGGGLDPTFGGDGRVVTEFNTGFDVADAIAVQDDGRIVAAGQSAPVRGSNYRFAIARYNPGGSLDSGFSGDGKVTTNFTTGYDYASDMALQDDGKIVAVGAAAGAGERFALAQYETTGALDNGFGGDGKVITNFNSGSDVATGVAVQSDGKIVAAGWSAPASGPDYRFAVARYNPGGSLDSGFGGDGKITTNFTSGVDYASDVALQDDGKIVAGGRARGAGGRFALARYFAG
jgi:uncharacterized delta-60 repeat protein